ncbi:MAG: acetylornithine/N-succinyldiaminopimelate aminotransferase [Pseudonocardiales bacterium]|nr:acetylornithine/N-succinyldiaminopimelate aminotransferase [Pseudonocardiales bacterium]
MSFTEELRQRFNAALMPTYDDYAPAIALTHGKGCRVTDADGREYLDFAGGLAANVLGHGHPDLVAAIARQPEDLIHTSNQYLHEREIELAERLQALVSPDGRVDSRVFFCNSGAEANEAALKLVRRQRPDRPVIVAALDGFHGRTMGSLALAGVPSVRDAYAPYVFDVRFVPYGDAAALAAAVQEDTAAVFLEPIQGEAGVIRPPDGYLRAAREICDAAGALFVLDEVQSGIGRTGRWFAHQHENVLPDVMTLSKGLAGGMPIGACIGIGEYAIGLTVGQHGSTFGGNPVSCAAALAVLQVIERDGLMHNAVAVGDALAAGIESLGHPLVERVRGRGLWRAMVLSAPLGVEIGEAAARAGFLVSPVRPQVIRLAPALILTAAEAAEFVGALPAILADAATTPPSS